MYRFLIPLLIGFAFNWASAFTHFYSKRWGPCAGMLTSFHLRNILGIPVWVFGLALAASVLGWGYVFVQARLEEIDLVQRIPAYREYMQRAPRFFPLFGRGLNSSAQAPPIYRYYWDTDFNLRVCMI